jgi:hypothetical protein
MVSKSGNCVGLAREGQDGGVEGVEPAAKGVRKEDDKRGRKERRTWKGKRKTKEREET